MEATQQQKAAIKKLTRRANRRIERASGGQKSALQYQVKKSTGQEKFSAATKGLSYEEAALKLKQLDKFLGAKTTTISGWKEAKAQNVAKATETLGGQGYDLSDEEFSEILEQVDSKNKQDFYAAINKVQAVKSESGDLWEGSSDQISNAISEKMTAQQALERAISARPEIGARRK